MTSEPNQDPKQNFSKKDVPSKEEQHELETAVKKLLNPDGSNQQMNGYIESTFSYVQEALDKMANSTDKDATANAIAEDLKQKWGGWAEQQKADKERRRQERVEQGKSKPRPEDGPAAPEKDSA